MTVNTSYDSTFREQKHLQHPLILTHKFSRGRPESGALSQSGFRLSRQRKHGEETLQCHLDRSHTDDHTHTLAFGVDVVLLGRAESVVLIGCPGDRARHAGESDLTHLLLSRAIILMLTMGFRHSL